MRALEVADEQRAYALAGHSSVTAPMLWAFSPALDTFASMLILKPLGDKRIALLWSAQLLSATGGEFYIVAVIWTASALVGNDAGYIAALRAGILLVGSLFGGILADRWRHTTTMIGVSVAQVVLLSILSGASAFGFMSLALLAAVTACVALAASLYEPALQATLPTFSPDSAKRHAVNGLFDATRRMARILGPSLIALVNGVIPIGQFFAVTAGGFLLAAIGLRAGLKDLPAEAPETRRGLAAVVDAVAGGARAVQRHRVMQFGLIGDLIGNITWAMAMLLGMALYLKATSANPLTDYSLMMTAYGVGNLGANLILANIALKRPMVWLVISKLIFGLGVMALPFAPDRTWLMAIAAFAAVNGPFENLALLHIIQHDFPRERIAQVYRLLMCAVFGGALIGYLAASSLFATLGIGPTITALGALTLAAGVFGLVLSPPWERRTAV